MEPNKSKIDRSRHQDPFAIGSNELYSLIFQHLSGSELLTLSETTRQCYQLVAASNLAINKIQLSIDEKSDRIFKWSDMKNSKRNYPTLKVKNLVRNREEVALMIVRFSHMLISIETNYDFSLKGLLIPKLRTLIISINNNAKLFFDGLLNAATNLDKLHFSGITREPVIIIECLYSNVQLKELVLEKGAPSIVFRFMKDTVFLGLKKLKCDNVDFLRDRESSHFYDFLKCQSDSLIELKVLRCEMGTLSDYLESLPNLVKLTYSSPPYTCRNKKVKFNMHQRLRELNLITTSTYDIKKLVCMAPRVRKLYIADVTQEIFLYIIRYLPYLREFHYAYFKDFSGKIEHVRSSYEKLIAKNTKFNRKITFYQI